MCAGLFYGLFLSSGTCKQRYAVIVAVKTGVESSSMLTSLVQDFSKCTVDYFPLPLVWKQYTVGHEKVYIISLY